MIILLYGPDTFRSRQKLKGLKNKFINEVDKQGLNLAVLDGAKLDTAEFENAIATPPFLAKKRMVVIEDLISKNKGQKIQKEILETLSKNNLDDTIIIFWESKIGETKTKKSKTSARRSNLLLQRLKTEKYVQEFKLLNPYETTRWVNEEIKKRKGKINSQAAAMLADFVGNDLWQLNSEIEKLLAYCNNKEIKVEDIQNLVKTKIDDDIFKLTDAVGQKNKKLALKLIADQFKNGLLPTELLSRLNWQFRNLLLVKSFAEQNGDGYPDNRLAYQTGLHPFVVKKTMAQARNHDLASLKKSYSQILAIEHKIKTSQVDPAVLFDLLIVES